MALEKNNHVARLLRYQPFQPDAAALVYENSGDRERGYDTVVLKYLADAVEDPSIHLIVLTGDAGHGKTSLCALSRPGCDGGSHSPEGCESWQHHGSTPMSFGSARSG
jgi:hypothetical protein